MTIGETELAGQPVEFTATLRELRERRLPELDDSFAQSMGAFDDVAGLRADIQPGSTATPSTGPATHSRTGSSSTPWPTPPSPRRTSSSSVRSTS